MKEIERRSFLWMTKLFFFRSFLSKRKNFRIFVFEGELHLLLLMDLQKKNEKSIDRFLDTLFVDDVRRAFISVKTPIETVMFRTHSDYATSGIRPRLFHVDEQKRKEFYEQVERSRQRLNDILRKKGNGISVIEVEGSKPPQENADSITEYIKKEFLV